MEIDWKKYNTIVIIGLPATGKTFLASRLPSGYKRYHTDDYMEHDFEDALYHLMDDLRRYKSREVVIEGVQGYRLLRKLAQRKMRQPDLIVKCVAPTELREHRYYERGKILNKGFDKMLTKIWMDYVIEVRDQKPAPKCFMYDTVANKIIGDQIL
jgi:deoxyadenosine/deoxycytidine kinase